MNQSQPATGAPNADTPPNEHLSFIFKNQKVIIARDDAHCQRVCALVDDYVKSLKLLTELLSCDDEGIKIVLLADKLSNVRDFHRSYGELGEKLWDSFTVKDKNLVTSGLFGA